MPGVGALIFKPVGSRRGPILLVERAGEPLKGYWSLPGGLVENGETLSHAVVREVREETGLEVKPTGLFGLFERIIHDTEHDTEKDSVKRAEYHYLLADYICEVTGGQLHPGDDVSRVEWVPRKRLSDYLLTDGTLEVIEQAYSSRRKLSMVNATILSVTGTPLTKDAPNV